jgi:hypothetical protein
MSDNGEDERNANEGDGQSDESCDDRPVGDVSLSLDTALEILANHDRRAIIEYLRDTSDHTATIDELANYLVSQKAERASEHPGRDHLQTTLHHVHVPKLVDSGLIDYDARNQEIRYRGSDRLERWHDRIQGREN